MSQATPSTQQHINIAQIKDGIVITRSGDFRVVLEVTPVNFALRSEEDQNVLIGQYQSFLNALTFPIQIIVQSRRLDLHPYLSQLDQVAQNQPNELLSLQAAEYIEFIKRLTTLVNIMDKKFYIVVPFTPPATQKVGGLKNLFTKKTSAISFTQAQFVQYKDLLGQRVTTIETGLTNMGLATARLPTKQLVELYYYAYNPEEATEERLAESVEDIEAPIIQKATPAPAGLVTASPPLPQPPATSQNSESQTGPPANQNRSSAPANTIENKASLLNQANPTQPAS